MKKLVTKWFRKWSKKSKIDLSDLQDTIRNLETGSSSTNLGDNLYKVRVKRKHGGKSSGYRTIIVYQENNRAIFLYGFAKNEKDNISKLELDTFKKLGNDLLSINDEDLLKLIINHTLYEFGNL